MSGVQSRGVGPAAGESAQARFERERRERNERFVRAAPLIAAAAVISSTFSFWLSWMFFGWPVPFVAAIATVALFAWYLYRSSPEVLDWKRGAEAERRVAHALAGLEDAAFVALHDRSVQGKWGNIDSVVVGPPGVFIVETKWRGREVDVANGRLLLGNREQPQIVAQVRDLAVHVQVSVASAMSKHRLTVEPLICIGNRSVPSGLRAGGIPVLDSKTISSYLLSLPEVLTADEVNELARELDYALPRFDRR